MALSRVGHAAAGKGDDVGACGGGDGGEREQGDVGRVWGVVSVCGGGEVRGAGMGWDGRGAS